MSLNEPTTCDSTANRKEKPADPWHASLTLEFERRGPQTVLSHRSHEGPLRVQKALYPEGQEVCHAIVLHPPAGIAGGDQLDIRIATGDGAHALLTTPGAGKWYRSAGAEAAQSVRLSVDAGAMMEWLPQETIIFSGARATIKTHVDLGVNARFLGVETICYGRRASGETFANGVLRLSTDIVLGGRLLWRERGRIDGGSALLASPIGLAGYSVCSTVLAVGVDTAPDQLAACRAAGSSETEAKWGVSAMPQLLVGRYLGHSAEAAREWFMALWQVLRPALAGRDAIRPRIWST